MKFLKITLLTIILSSINTFAQLENRWTLNDFEELEMLDDNNEIVNVKHFKTTEVVTPVILDPEDKYKLNQDIIYLPTQVTKTIRIDADSDYSFDKEAKVSYIKSKEADLNFMLTKKGLVVSVENNNIRIEKMIDKNNVFFTMKDSIFYDGLYTLHLSNGKTIELNVTDFNTIK